MISPSRTLPGPGLGPSPQDRHRPSDASSDLALAVAFQGALSRTIRSWRRSCDYRRLRSRTGGSRLQGVPPFHSEWFRFKGVPFSKWMGFTPRGSPPLYSEWDSLQRGPFFLLQVNKIHLKGLPLSTANGIRFRGVPFSKANGIRLLGVPPYPGGSLLQVNEIHLKGLPLSTAHGICFKGVPFSKAKDFCFQRFPLSTATVFRFNKPCFISTSALVPCFI